MKIPNFLRNLLQSNNYWDKNSTEFAKANEYLGKLFPDELQQDATGQYIEPKYDMTYEQFLDAQKKFDNDIQNAIQEAEEEIEEETGNTVDCSEFVEIEEEIEVRVLMPWGDIQNERLIVYTLDLPDDDEEPTEAKKIWIWHSEDDERICDDCTSHNGEVFEDKDDIPDIPVHPNCRCWVEEVELDDNGKPISSKVYKGQKPETPKNDKETPSEKTPTFDKPVDIKPGQYAKFDGKTLAVYDEGEKIVDFEAVSGKPGYQSSQYQNKKDTGPIPEGTYVARKKDFQNRDDYGPIKRYTSWPGGEHGWGKHRVWLEPSKETNTYGRGGFSIHGGEEPGSAGCIDLTSEMPGFANWFKKNGKDLIIKVQY